MIKDPITGETRSNNGIVFVDGLIQIVISNVSLCKPTMGQWSSHSRIAQRRQLRSIKVKYSLNREVNVLLPPRRQIVDAVAGGETLVVVEHQLPEMEIKQQLTGVDQIRWIPQWQLRQSSSDRFRDYLCV